MKNMISGLDDIELGTQSVMSRAYLSWFGFKGQSQQSKVRIELPILVAILFLHPRLLFCTGIE